jgi:hypothetical protein
LGLYVKDNVIVWFQRQLTLDEMQASRHTEMYAQSAGCTAKAEPLSPAVRIKDLNARKSVQVGGRVRSNTAMPTYLHPVYL